MSTRIQHADGSMSIHPDGCRPGFLAHLAPNQSFFIRSFALDNEFMDYSAVSLKRLDELLKAHKQTKQPFSPAFVEGAIAYCGEVVRAQTGGKWFVQEWFAEELAKTCYFPGIETPASQLLDVSNAIEADPDYPTDSRLHSRIALLVSTATALPAVQWKEHPLGNEIFPPL
jgi:hypothetical protein